jgi:hypothetical protein
MPDQPAPGGSHPRRVDNGFENDVLAAELAAVKQRSAAATRSQKAPEGLPDFTAHLNSTESFSPFFERTRALLETPEQEKRWREWAAEKPRARHAGLTGVAFSGGGIRSSTINLGIAQVLERIGLFECLDYLSTVSGGGYVGSSLSSCYSPRDPEAVDEVDGVAPDRALERAREQFPFRHEPGTPEPAGFLQLRNYAKFLVPRGFVDYLKFPVLLLRGVLVNFLVLLPWIIGAALFSALFLRVVGESVIWIWSTAIEWPFGIPAFGPTVYITGVFIALALLFPIVRLVRLRLDARGRARELRSGYESLMVAVLVLVAVDAWIEIQPLALVWLRRVIDQPQMLTATIGGGSAIFAAFGNLFAKRIKSWLGRIGLYLVALIGALAFWLLYLLLCDWLVETPVWWTSVFASMPVWAVLSILLLALIVYTNLFIDANGLSMHNFYRDRLAEAFLFRVNERQDEVEPNADLRFTELSKHVGPLHVVNLTLNTQKFPTPFRKGRRAEPFFVTALHAGSRITGYCETQDLEREQPDLFVAPAVATSGAAISSNMGTQTNVALRFILSMLNVRLGYWLKNPRLVNPQSRTLGIRLGSAVGVGVVRFLQELTGRLSYETSYVYLSDGGHIENIGLYELIRRQCRFIVIGDGECDPHYNFHGLTEALRLVQVDFGIQIEMDGLDEIRSGEQQFARGTIQYPEGRIGYLIYLKSSLLGDDMVEATVSQDAYVTSPLRSDVRRYDELGYMARYKADHPDFPHESTADQFFDETQFECYRALGYLVAKRAFLGTQ